MKGTWGARAGWPSAGQVLAVASAAPALVLAGWLLAGVTLLLLGRFGPVQTILLGVALAFLLGRYGLRRMPETVEATARQTAALLGIALAFGVFNGVLHGEQLIVRRDPATYAQYAIWLATEGTLPITTDTAAFGGPDPALRFDSVGFYRADAGGSGGDRAAATGPNPYPLENTADEHPAAGPAYMVPVPGTGGQDRAAQPLPPEVVPQFMPGTPIVLAFGHWMGGVPGLLLMPAVLGALAVLTFGGTVARLVGTRWSVLAAAALAVSMPLLYTSRAPFSETCSLILLFGAVNLLLDARHRMRASLLGVGFLPAAPEPPAREGSPAGLVHSLARTRSIQAVDATVVAALAGLIFGLAPLVRIDALRDVLPVLAYAGLLIAIHRHRRAILGRGYLGPAGRLGRPLLGGLLAGGTVSGVAAYLLARPYLADLEDSLRPLLAICGAVAAATLLGIALAPRLGRAASRLVRRPGGRVARVLPGLAAGLVVAVVAGFALRPWVHTVHRTPTTAEDLLTAEFIAKAQAANGLPVDGTRLYYEDSLYWVLWYVGAPALVLATMAAAMLARRLAQGRAFVWLLPLAIIGWTTVTTLWRPAITPDHPFASRRLVPIIIPGVILLAAWGMRWALARYREAGHGRPRQRALLVAGALLLLVPPAVTSIGTAFTPVGRGEAAAVAGLCRAIPRNATVLIVERVTGDRFTQVVRGMCAVPTARVAVVPGTDLAAPADVTRLATRVRSAGRVPVLLAAEQGQLAGYGKPVHALSLRTRQDERSLVTPPDGTWRLWIDVWLAVPT